MSAAVSSSHAGPPDLALRADAPLATSAPPRDLAREEGQKMRWAEPVIALLMALATVGTAWCSYESAAWTRRSGRLMNEFNSLERQAALLNLQGMQAVTIQVAMFMQ